MAHLIVFGPLFAAAIAGLFGNYIGHRASQIITTTMVVLSALLSVWMWVDVAYGGNTQTHELATWMTVGSFDITWNIRLDALSAVMLVVVTSVSSLVHIYSWGYMSHDPHRARFFAYLSLFTFAMLSLVTADNFLQLFFGWEGVGLASYLLIGFWYKKRSANDAAIKAFVTNRVGDFGFALGIMAVFYFFGTLSFDDVFASLSDHSMTTFTFLGIEWAAIELIAILLFIGAMGKSAQFFLHVWLPDAMEGPTPVSALIHAATMVTAGVFLVCRCFPIFEMADGTSAFITFIGLTTAFFAATIGLAQNDIKRVIAYSTCSQLGYMFFAAGLGLYGAAMFHLFTHAFFKALLFLGSGSVIHGLSDEQDMRKMGGIYKMLPITWLMMIIGTLALTGVGLPLHLISIGDNPLPDFGFAGFFSKDAIIEGAYAMGVAGKPFGTLAFWVGVVAALLTSFYSWRLILMTFHGEYRGDKHVLEHAHESPAVMLVPLFILALGAVGAGAAFKPDFIGDRSDHFWGEALVAEAHGDAGHDEAGYGEGHDAHADDHATDDHAVDTHGADTAHAANAAHAEDTHAEDGQGEHHDDGHGDGHGDGHHLPTWAVMSPFTVTWIGFFAALWAYGYNAGMGARMAARGGPINSFLSNKWYFDELYDVIFVKSARALGDFFWKVVDVKIIDGLGPNGFAGTTLAAARRIAQAQSGFLYHYAFVMLIGVLGLTVWIVAGAGGH